ncbi:hypothetical protein Q8F57_045355 [Paraburkholderia terrae]|uniref:Signal transduction histidine kinase n=1 Tax=Paraburkholderia terrae TaxID=311230 RepID=A0ABN6JVZ9_9BURK|nr:hypothetical protein [Paraburkholderia terrae]MDW3660615.1 hypothetical protein [Paraburkholderia terrae]BCZ85114.1 hypothetical protein PTKU64_87890 [Paraburkholderia terrae]
MKIRTIVIATGVTLLGLFTILNWDTFSRPTLLDMVVARVDAPLGIILLCAIGVLTLIYALSVARLEITVQLEARRMKNEMEQLREIADKATESRVQALQDFLVRETQRIDVKLDMLLESAKHQPNAPHTGYRSPTRVP